MRRLRLLVTSLMVVLIVGMVVVVAAMVVRLGLVGEPAPLAPVTAGQFTLPQGAEVVAIGRGPGEVVILTRDAAGAETLRVFDAASGTKISATPVVRE